MARKRATKSLLEGDPLWYKDAVFYELRVGAFQDSDGDGIGDFRGLTQRLDYLHDLGITTIWLLPFCPSPWRDDGYDISDYTNVHPDCGTLADFRHFLREAHRRGLRVVTELVINHTSDQHPWFQRARRAPAGSRFRNFYVWSDTPEKFSEARVIFKDFEPSNWSWDPIAKAYYWHRFYAHQPDLNFDHPDVRKAVLRFLAFWLDLGVDGLRLDAVPYLYEREGTNCENLPETHAFLRELRAFVDDRYEDRMLLAEANQWSEDAAAYFGAGDACHMCFHFPVMPRLFMALHMEDRFPIIDILMQTPPIPDGCQWAVFLRNHDELTLEMVTDEERDYMYRVYAHDAEARINLGIRRRLAPLLGRDRRRIELMNALLFSLPGTPVIYYGDEIGMGDNFYLGDRNGVRTPMQWNADRNAGFSTANPQRLYLPVILDPEYHYESLNVEAQQNNSHSLLWWMKRIIALRKRHKAFGRGTIEFLSPQNRHVVVFVRRYEDERILVVANLSRFVQYVELDLSAYKGMVAIELFGRNAFPPIGDAPYFLSLGPHSFYWFGLTDPAPASRAAAVVASEARSSITLSGSGDNLFRGDTKSAIERLLPAYLASRRWFGGKAVPIKSASIRDVVELSTDSHGAHLVFVRVEHADDEADTYALVLGLATGERAARVRTEVPEAVVADVQMQERGRRTEGILFDALADPGFARGLLEAISRRRPFRAGAGVLVPAHTRAFRGLRGPLDVPLEPRILQGEQSNTSVAYGDRLVLKLFRRVLEGVNPDLEIGRYLTDRGAFAHIAPVAASLEYRRPRHESVTVAILQAFVPNEGDAWRYTIDQLEGYFQRALTHEGRPPAPERDDETSVELIDQDPPPLVGEMVGAYLETARLLGRRTAELHVALSANKDDPLFQPERFTTLYQRSLYQSFRNLTARVFGLVRDRLKDLPAGTIDDAKKFLGVESRVLEVFREIVGQKLHTLRIRTHGDYHLGQILHTGKDFVIVDFEGEPSRTLNERRLKRSALRDVAGMLRSFDYAVSTVLIESAGTGVARPVDVRVLEPWAHFWRRWVSSAFLRSYIQHAGDDGLVPASRAELSTLLRVLLLEKSVYEVGYELGSRPAWVRVPLQGVLRLVAAAVSAPPDARDHHTNKP